MRSSSLNIAGHLVPVVFALLFGSLFSLSVAAGERKVVELEEADLGLPFSAGILTDDFLYVSGTTGNLPGTREVPGDIKDQTRQALQNSGAVLKAAGLDFSNVVATTVYLSNAQYFSQMNQVYKEFFPVDPPARATVEADIVLPGAYVEIGMIAARRDVKKQPVRPSGWQQPAFPYSWGISAGNTLFVAGLVSSDPESGKIIPGNVQFQTDRALKNLGSVLEAADMDYSDVVSCRVYLSDARFFQAMNRVYRRFFPDSPPVRATVRSRLASPDLLVEIQCEAVRASNREFVGTRGPTTPFSPAIRVGQRLYLSGMVGRGPAGFAAGDIREQTRQTLVNLKETLEMAGLGFEDVVDATVFLADVRHYDDMNQIYREMMPDAPPARATAGAQLMSPEAIIEITMTAVVSKPEE